MRYCLVSRELAPFFGAGIGTYASQMARAMADAGHEATVVTGRHEGLERAEEGLPGVRVLAAEPEGHADHARLPFHFQRHAAAVRRLLLELHAETPFDIIEFPEYYGEGCWALWGRRSLGELAGARIVCHLHMTTALCRELNEERRTNLETLAMQAAERETIRLADALVSPSRALLERTRADLAAIGVVAPAGVAIPYPFDVAAARRDLGAADGRASGRATEVATGRPHSERDVKEPAASDAATATSVLPTSDPESEQTNTDILFFGRLERRKGPDLLARAALRLLADRPGLRVRFIGGDTSTGPGQSSMRAHLQRLTKDHAGNFIFTDRVARAVLGPQIAAAKVVCLPSRWDNFPNALLEAMSLGASCVVGGAGGMAEIVEDGVSGMVCDPEDESALAGALTRALDDDGLRQRMGAAARERIEGLCDPQSIVTRRVEHFESLAAADGGSRPAASGADRSAMSAGSDPASEGAGQKHRPRRRANEAAGGSGGSSEKEGRRRVVGGTGGAGATRVVTVAVEGDWLRRARAAAREGAVVALLRPGEATGEAFVGRCAEALRRTGAELAAACARDGAPVGLDREALAAAEWSGPVMATAAALERADGAAGSAVAEAPEEAARWALLCACALAGAEMAVVPDPLVGRAAPARGMAREWIARRYPELARVWAKVEEGERVGVVRRVWRRLGGRHG